VVLGIERIRTVERSKPCFTGNASDRRRSSAAEG
jgi:hypothetical protein